MASNETPQDKKARSLARDRRNSYGENDKSSRTAIRSRKRWVNRIARQAIQHGLAAPRRFPNGARAGIMRAWPSPTIP